MKRGILGLFGALAMVGTVHAQTEELYIVDGGSGRISVVQGGAVVRSWNQPNTAMPVAVMNTVRTYVQYSTSGDGSEYQLDGTPTGTTYPYQGESNTGRASTAGPTANTTTSPAGTTATSGVMTRTGRIPRCSSRCPDRRA